jgi:hypothetical protein
MIVARARSRIVENRYCLVTNNCEHFCAWCIRGESRSMQVDCVLAWPRAVAAAFARLGRHARRERSLLEEYGIDRDFVAATMR